jgi:uncharacterized protein
VGNPLLVNVAELCRRSGTRRDIAVDVRVDELAIEDPRWAPDTGVHVAVQLESLLDGIVVEGEVRSTWQGDCRRCLRPITGALNGAVHELYQRECTAEESFPIEGEQLDLTEMVRAVLLIDAPLVPVCRADCAGLCPTCGADLNDGPCGCAVAPADPRWAALDVWRVDPER